jgi:hypothetical protein
VKAGEAKEAARFRPKTSNAQRSTFNAQIRRD